MPEIAEVARAVHFLRKSLVGKFLKVVKAQDDANVFGKVGTSAAKFQEALTGKKVVDAGQQGKYFWLILSSPPHPVFHFGMTGSLYIRGDKNVHYRPRSPEETDLWPPKFWKFSLETDGEVKSEVAFTDSRRFARIRLVDCAGEDIRKTTPLKENGPDPVIDKDVLTVEWLEKKMLSKKVPVKALLLDQANISGIGNWVGDEIMYHAKLHPEQYSNSFTIAEIKQLHASIRHVCQTAVDCLADSTKFPDSWMFNHRWGKGKKDAATKLPNGSKITFITVGGRTSCIVPSVQKKTGAIAGGEAKEHGADDSDSQVDGKVKPNASKKRKAISELKRDEDSEVGAVVVKAESVAVKKEGANESVMKTNAKSASAKKRRAVPGAKHGEENFVTETPPRKRSGQTQRPTLRSKKASAPQDDVEGESRKSNQAEFTRGARNIKTLATAKPEMKSLEVASKGRRRSGRIAKQ